MPRNSSSEPPASQDRGLQQIDLGISVVIPCHRETAHILDVIAGIGPEISHIFVVDDACPDQTGDHVRSNCTDDRVEVIVQSRNTGVGGATVTGYKAALAVSADIIVKLDGDGQMDPALIPELVEPLVAGRADYTKGNRFDRAESLGGMPATRIVGNITLSLASKFSSGYWNIFDPTNGFTAIHAEAARRLPLDQLANGYFFESDMLFRLGVMRAVVEDVSMRARYGEEVSGIQLHKIVPEFAVRHALNACRRIGYTYLIREVNAATLQLFLGVVLLTIGIVFGISEWQASASSGIPATAGTVILAALPIIVGSQMLISFLNFDTENVPKTPLQAKGGGRAEEGSSRHS
jgi:glycosyltransferase involved in cell wall biosynthesis